MEATKSTLTFTYKICLIDDDMDDQELFAYRFQDVAHQRTVFASGKSALRYLQQLSRPEHPSLIVTDYEMPGMNGAELLQAIKANLLLSHIPVVVYSTAMTERLQQKLKACGAAACFPKSFSLAELKEYLLALEVVFRHSVFH